MENENMPKPFAELLTKEDVVQCLVTEWGARASQFYNNTKSKSVEKFWTFNRCARHLGNLRKNYHMTPHGYRLNTPQL
jgi:hypothetical protein